MAKYNVYKIREGQADNLEENLVMKGYLLTREFDSGNFLIKAFFTPTPQPTEIWWLEQYEGFFPGFEDKKNQIFSGVVLAKLKNSQTAYVIALGKTHFYVQAFIDLGFGLDLAEKIAESSATKTKSTKQFGGATSKAITSFTNSANLSFLSGEATEYLKLKTKEPTKWGKSYIHFGTSAQFNNIEINPTNIGELLSNVSTALESGEEGLPLPRMLAVSDEAQVNALDTELSEQIMDTNTSPYIGIYDYELFGVDFIFSQATQVRLVYRENEEDEWTESEKLDELSVEDIRGFVEENGLSLPDVLRHIKVQVFVDDRSKYFVELVKLIDYVAEDKRFLLRGKWFVFNKSFEDSIRDTISQVGFSVSALEFNSSEYATWLKSQPQSQKVRYPEKYMIDKIKENNQDLEINDRDLEYKAIRGKTKSFEVSDLVDRRQKEIIVVKKGTMRDFGYAFNQAYTTITQLNKNKLKLASGDEIEIKKLKILLATTNKNPINSVLDTKSLNFEIQLNELFLRAEEKKVDLHVEFSHYQEGN